MVFDLADTQQVFHRLPEPLFRDAFCEGVLSEGFRCVAGAFCDAYVPAFIRHFIEYLQEQLFVLDALLNADSADLLSSRIKRPSFQRRPILSPAFARWSSSG